MNGCILGKYFNEMEREQERGRICRCQLKSNSPTSCQWSSVSMLRFPDVSPSVEGLVESRTAWVRLKVSGTCREERKRNSTKKKKNLHRTRRLRIPVTSFMWAIIITCHGYSMEIWENRNKLRLTVKCIDRCAMKALHRQKTLQHRHDELTDGYSTVKYTVCPWNTCHQETQ